MLDSCLARNRDPPMSSSERASSPPSGTDTREIEWQLAVPDLGIVRRWLEEHKKIGALLILPRPRQILRDTYLDTGDWRMFRAGFALRLRESSDGAEATLKSLHSAREDRADRREITEPLPEPDDWLRSAHGPVGPRVREIAGDVALKSLFTVHTTRARFAVHNPLHPADIGEIALDETEFRSPANTPLGRLQRVEVETLGAPLAALEGLVETLREQCGLEPARENKFAVGLRLAGLVTPPPM